MLFSKQASMPAASIKDACSIDLQPMKNKPKTETVSSKIYGMSFKKTNMKKQNK